MSFNEYGNQPGRSTVSEYYDASIGAPVMTAASEVRAAFLRKVYVMLLAGIAVAMGTGLWLLETAIATGIESSLALWVRQHWIVLLIGYLALAFGAQAVSRVRGLNIAAYLAFTAFTGLIVSPMLLVAYVNGGAGFGIIWNAFGITALLFGGLTAYVFISGRDFSFLGGFIWVGLLVLIGFMVATFFFDAPAFAMGVTAGGLLLFALFVLYDTSRIMHHLGPDEWAAGALSLFIDFINMFIRILALLSDRR